jgi:hypothetical protein
MNVMFVTTAAGIGVVPTTYSIVQTGNYHGDGRSDLLWRDNSGNTAIWFMNGVAVSSAASLGKIATTRTMQSVNAE